MDECPDRLGEDGVFQLLRETNSALYPQTPLPDHLLTTTELIDRKIQRGESLTAEEEEILHAGADEVGYEYEPQP